MNADPKYPKIAHLLEAKTIEQKRHQREMLVINQTIQLLQQDCQHSRCREFKIDNWIASSVYHCLTSQFKKTDVRWVLCEDCGAWDRGNGWQVSM